MQIRCIADIVPDPRVLGAGERGYRRGVAQALYLAGQVARGSSARDLSELAGLAQSWRYDRQPHLAFLDELVSAWRRSKPKKPATNVQW